MRNNNAVYSLWSYFLDFLVSDPASVIRIPRLVIPPDANDIVNRHTGRRRLNLFIAISRGKTAEACMWRNISSEGIFLVDIFKIYASTQISISFPVFYSITYFKFSYILFYVFWFLIYFTILMSLARIVCVCYALSSQELIHCYNSSQSNSCYALRHNFNQLYTIVIYNSSGSTSTWIIPTI